MIFEKCNDWNYRDEIADSFIRIYEAQQNEIKRENNDNKIRESIKKSAELENKKRIDEEGYKTILAEIAVYALKQDLEKIANLAAVEGKHKIALMIEDAIGELQNS